MASFNLGRIKGEKGDAGTPGERGIQGERGVQGAQGVSGFTPVFSVKEIITVDDNEGARVEIDSSDIKNPLLTFYIPKGADGKDAMGDMISSIYDSKGKKCDVFEYADLLFDGAMKKSGGELFGKVKAYSADTQDLCVRNIVVANSFPEDACLGDICIVIKSESSIAIGDQEIGTNLIIKENGINTPYIIVGKNFLESGTVELIRRDILLEESFFDRAGNTDYSLSAADLFLETMYSKTLDKSFLGKLLDIEISDSVKRKIFLPSSYDMANLEYFKENTRMAKKTDGRSSGYWVRGLYSGINTIINSQGQLEALSAKEKCGYRPMIALKNDTCVVNTVFKSNHAVTFPEEKCGVYIFDGEVWKECIALDN